MRNYTRWTNDGENGLKADILGAGYELYATPESGMVNLHVDRGGFVGMNPDEARMLGVRLIEAAALADGNRAIREAGI